MLRNYDHKRRPPGIPRNKSCERSRELAARHSRIRAPSKSPNQFPGNRRQIHLQRSWKSPDPTRRHQNQIQRGRHPRTPVIMRGQRLESPIRIRGSPANWIQRDVHRDHRSRVSRSPNLENRNEGYVPSRETSSRWVRRNPQPGRIPEKVMSPKLFRPNGQRSNVRGHTRALYGTTEFHKIKAQRCSRSPSHIKVNHRINEGWLRQSRSPNLSRRNENLTCIRDDEKLTYRMRENPNVPVHRWRSRSRSPYVIRVHRHYSPKYSHSRSPNSVRDYGCEIPVSGRSRSPIPIRGYWQQGHMPARFRSPIRVVRVQHPILSPGRSRTRTPTSSRHGCVTPVQTRPLHKSPISVRGNQHKIPFHNHPSSNSTLPAQNRLKPSLAHVKSSSSASLRENSRDISLRDSTKSSNRIGRSLCTNPSLEHSPTPTTIKGHRHQVISRVRMSSPNRIRNSLQRKHSGSPAPVTGHQYQHSPRSHGRSRSPNLNKTNSYDQSGSPNSKRRNHPVSFSINSKLSTRFNDSQPESYHNLFGHSVRPSPMVNPPGGINKMIQLWGKVIPAKPGERKKGSSDRCWSKNITIYEY